MFMKFLNDSYFVVGWLYHGPVTTFMEDVCKCVLCNRSALGRCITAGSNRSVYYSVDALFTIA